jgi:alanine-glyoxylate transaminase/serine-glyoxylate transaminase/serine-pyruvate transaminase
VAWDGFIGRMGQSDVIVATGLLPELRTRYFRVGHMGAVSQADLLATTGAIGQALQGCGHDVPASAGLTAMLKAIDAV